MVFRSFGIKRPALDPAITDRIPPGQYLTERCPVLHFGSAPSSHPATWNFSVNKEVGNTLRFTWEEFQAVPMVTMHADTHCDSMEQARLRLGRGRIPHDR